uniref:STAS domain-containing protein n=1 Tax=Sphenodon punctatus TaxID=8508 RepID=A0A8D0GT31_SPHPU
MSSLAFYRGIYTEEHIQQVYGTPQLPPSSLAGWLKGRLLRGCQCSREGTLRLLRHWLPITAWLPGYRPKEWLLGDMVAGLTVGIIHIPQGMAFALLTSVAPVYGLYTSFFPVVLYMLFGTGRHVSTGTFAVVSLMTGSAVERLVPGPLEPNATSSEELAQIEGQRIGLAAAIAFLMGLLMMTMFALRLGALSTFLSEPIVQAFTNGAALHVLVSQLQSLLGLPLHRPDGCFTLYKMLTSVVEALPLTNVAELLISGLCLGVLVPIKEINRRYQSRLPTPIPGEIVMVLVATGICFASSLDTRYNVQIVGHLPAGFPQPQLPALRSLPHVIGDTIAVTFVAYAVSVSLAMIYADKHHYSIDPNQELLAHGLANLVSSLFTCFPSSATLATTSILESAGGHTQLSGLFSSVVVLVVLLWIGPLFYYLPKAVLACINVTSLRQMFLQFQNLPELWRISRIDFAVWVVTLLAVVVLNVDLGLAVGVVFSMVTVVCRTQRYRAGGFLSLGLVPLPLLRQCLEVPGLKILSYPAPIYYGNRGFFREALSHLLGLRSGFWVTLLRRAVPSVPPGAVQVVILDCSGVAFVDSAGAHLLIQVLWAEGGVGVGPVSGTQTIGGSVAGTQEIGFGGWQA